MLSTLLAVSFLFGCINASTTLPSRGQIKYGSILTSTTEATSRNITESTKQTLSPEQVDINKTVEEVERILNKYPELPRLERNEILSILQNITEEDNEKLKEELVGALEEEHQKMQKNTSSKPVEKIKETSPRSVMVVLPFKAEDSKESLEELYTRSPIVLLEEQKEVPTTFRTTSTTSSTSSSSAATPTEPPYSIIEKEDTNFNPPLRIIGYRYHTTTAEPSRSAEQTNRSYTNFQDPEEVTSTFRTQEVSTVSSAKHEISSSTSSAVSEMKKPGSVWDDEPPYQSGTSQKYSTFHIPDTVDNFSIEDAMLVDMEKQSTAKDNKEDIPIVMLTTTPKIYVTNPEVTTPKVYLTTDDEFAFSKITTPKVYITTEEPKKTSTEKLETTTKKKYKQKTEKNKPHKTEVIKSVIENLPPHMKDMFNNIGLDAEVPASSEYVPKPPKQTMAAEIDPSSFQQFKPLPMKRQKTISEDMQGFLASFGLLDGQRHQKALTAHKSSGTSKYLDSAPEINPDLLTESMKATLQNLGLYNQTLSKTSRNHIFNPSNHTSAQTDEEIHKLNALLATIKKLASLDDSEPVTLEFQNEILKQVKDLDNITISYKSSAAINDEIHKILDRNKGKLKIPIVLNETVSSNTLLSGLNPEFYDEIQLKNEVKRQENSSTTTTSTTEPANSPELEESFGGGGVAPADSNPAESLPPKRPNGLYFLLDWNTFFQVGTEDDRRRVNIRFQPKIGDGRNFLPVTIP